MRSEALKSLDRYCARLADAAYAAKRRGDGRRNTADPQALELRNLIQAACKSMRPAERDPAPDAVAKDATLGAPPNTTDKG